MSRSRIYEPKIHKQTFKWLFEQFSKWAGRIMLSGGAAGAALATTAKCAPTKWQNGCMTLMPVNPKRCPRRQLQLQLHGFGFGVSFFGRQLEPAGNYLSLSLTPFTHPTRAEAHAHEC